jgi:hypothetical protein
VVCERRVCGVEVGEVGHGGIAVHVSWLAVIWGGYRLGPGQRDTEGIIQEARKRSARRDKEKEKEKEKKKKEKEKGTCGRQSWRSGTMMIMIAAVVAGGRLTDRTSTLRLRWRRWIQRWRSCLFKGYFSETLAKVSVLAQSVYYLACPCTATATASPQCTIQQTSVNRHTSG